MASPALQRFISVSFLCSLLCACSAWGGARIDLGSLLDEMVDRGAPARVPAPFFLCRQSSSYDRDTVDPDKDGWYANWDRSQFVRIETRDGRKEYVMHDADGPGVIVRIWATWHGPGGGPFSNGTLRFYLDGSDTPAIEGPAASIISGGGLVGPPLSDSVSPLTPYANRGHNLYFPIPYAAHCKITYATDVEVDRGGKKGEALYYQINYRTYEPGTQVRSFAMSQVAEFKDRIAAVGARLLKTGAEGAGTVAKLGGMLAPGATATQKIEGPAAIRRLTVKLEAEDIMQALRSTVLQLRFDGEPCVWCPAGDFFGTGYQIHPFRTWYTQTEKDGTLHAFWVMPFRSSAELTLHNVGAQPVNLARVEAHTGAWDWNDRSMHFRAAWRQDTKIDTGPNKDMTGKGAFDVNYVEITGAGTYVGDTLTLFNGTNAWWGEGDEKIYIDGERFPSHIGTGTEDYYGYAWCRPEVFQAPFHAQPCGDGNLRAGFSVNSRYRGLDSIPFKKSLRVDMELWHWRHTKMNFAPSTFWYARPGGRANLRPDPASAALPVARHRSDVVEVVRVEGAIEGESLKILERTGGATEIQDIDTFDWSGNSQLWWIDANVGDRLVLALPVERAGRYRVHAQLTKAVDYGIVQISINGTNAGKPIDLFNRGVINQRFDLGVFDLATGVNRLEIVITGTNPAAVQRRMFGLDYLLVSPE